MPDHLHLVVASQSADLLLEMMSRELGAFAQTLRPGERFWQPLSPPKEVPNHLHLRRTIRYVHLNPCRDRLAADPLEWEWSTHRDALGLACSSWLDRPALNAVFDYSAPSFAKRFHEYVSSDPTVKVDGTSLPALTPESDIVSSLSSIEWAVLQATRAPGTSLRRPTPERRLMMLAAKRLGMNSQSRLAAWVGLTPRAVRNVLAAPITASEIANLGVVFRLLSDRARFEPRGGAKAR